MGTATQYQTFFPFLPLHTAMDDYTVDMEDLTVTVPAGMPTEMCIDVGIVNDDIALEEDETFEFYFDELDDGVSATDPSEAVVTIVDEDDGKFLIYAASIGVSCGIAK